MAQVVEGQCFAFDVTVVSELVDRFAELSGDLNPLHTDAAFARSRGFANRVAHGALLVALVSRMVGMECPGRDALIHSVSLQFKQPVYVGDSVRIQATVDQVSEATNTIVLKISITNVATGMLYAQGRVQAGSTATAL